MQPWTTKFTKDQLADGILYEPRAYTNVFRIPAATTENDIIDGLQPNVYLNGEKFPVQVTHMLVSFVNDVVGDTPIAVPDQRFLQFIGIRVRYEDQFYMRREHLAAPLWQNVPTAQSASFQPSTFSWGFDKPAVLSVRDTLQVSVQLGAPLPSIPADPQPIPQPMAVSVSAHGVGLLSGRPYFFGGQTVIPGEQVGPQFFEPDAFRNAGSEPILLHGLSGIAHNQRNLNDLAGAVRATLLVKQIGNGTNGNWIIGPAGYALGRAAFATLGNRSSQAVVHRIPGDGWIWRPGDGVFVDIKPVNLPVPSVGDAATVQISFLGTILVQ